jgi:hypothetical protein
MGLPGAAAYVGPPGQVTNESNKLYRIGFVTRLCFHKMYSPTANVNFSKSTHLLFIHDDISSVV